ncbi:hypothetical protein [Streptomyces abyssomicinicus]|uniref:hypothetical protein n=1 Tax=Streptomyces abyssomicinicus TaxID=574929 RepID=UPI00158186AD|nr:hypothetical protein [Streptomyces abyssomicinicus]
MICRNFIAPKRAFTQLANEIIRHPRLSSDAARILTWQLSLPPGATETLSETAKRARIGGSAFTTAKRQLIAEGYVHERRVPVERGRWSTQQLVSSVPLRPGEGLKLLAAVPAQGKDTTHRVTPQVGPSSHLPAVGRPTARPTGGQPLQNMEEKEKTSHHPAAAGDAAVTGATSVEASATDGPAATPATAPGGRARDDSSDSGTSGTSGGPASEALDQARALVEAFPALDPDLRGIPRAMRPELTRLTARWLAAGHTPADVRSHVLRGLPADGAPVRRPGGLLRYLLTDVPPLPTAARALTPPPEAPPRPQPLRECEGDRHDHPTMFRPTQDESLCPGCLASIAGAGTVGDQTGGDAWV